MQENDREKTDSSNLGSYVGSISFYEICAALCNSLFDCLDTGAGVSPCVEKDPK